MGFEPAVSGSFVRRRKGAFADGRDRRAEREALGRATVIICNSRRTQEDVVDRIGVPPDRTHVVYYGTDPIAFGPPTADERPSIVGWSGDSQSMYFAEVSHCRGLLYRMPSPLSLEDFGRCAKRMGG